MAVSTLAGSPGLGLLAILQADRTHQAAGPTTRRAYSHADIASPQKLICLPKRFSNHGTANIDPRNLIVPADQELQLRRTNHARQPPQKPKVKETVVRPLVARSSRSGDAATMRAPLSSAGAFVTLSHR